MLQSMYVFNQYNEVMYHISYVMWRGTDIGLTTLHYYYYNLKKIQMKKYAQEKKNKFA